MASPTPTSSRSLEAALKAEAGQQEGKARKIQEDEELVRLLLSSSSAPASGRRSTAKGNKKRPSGSSSSSEAPTPHVTPILQGERRSQNAADHSRRERTAASLAYLAEVIPGASANDNTDAQLDLATR